jgi:hypothetical protein
MKKIITILTLTLALCFTTISSRAQIVITPSIDSVDLEVFLQGFGLTISNLVINCPDTARGIFDGTNTNIGIANGLALTSGTVTNIPGPNNMGGITYVNGFPGDLDLDSLIPGFQTHDACVLEFDCVPAFNNIMFNYVFGSEEYQEFVGSAFNDVFAIFISGPGITGLQNIAYIPGTTTPVAINNVNAIDNSAFYVDNGGGNTAPQNMDSTVVQYDGFTTNLTGDITVNPGDTYHFKIAVADAGDQIFDSGVFIEAGSFRSINLTTIEDKEVPMITRVFPNPMSDIAIFGANRILANGTFELFDNVGRLVKKIESINSDRVILERKNLESGLFHYHVLENGVVVGKGEVLIN